MNASTDDLLCLIGNAGSTKLERRTNSVSASPGYEADTTSWECEITLAGYINESGTRVNISAKGKTPFEAVSKTTDALQEFLHSDEAKEYRDRYVDRYNQRVVRYENAPFDQKDRGFNPIYHPGKMYSEAKLG